MDRRTLLIGGATAAFATTAAAGLLLPRGLAPAQVFTRDGYALGGTDPIAYFTHGRPIAGDPTVTHDWAGARWAFVDAMHRAEFAAAPQTFAPRYGGFCAWAVAAKGALYSTQPANWAIVDGALYLNFDDAVQARWDADRAGFIRRADARWPGIVAQA
ncbi:YHS domain protein [Jannaschia sp. S6380]|uniref:YHS domain-containing (seleno)protein n=1 Tax=Jannaschia sp. S6380 TaxID=2926408 RepID=UPI001FF32C28|nr:YHS domain-containing (seleno)protein [Jannaschia sp. S6380]MCK0167119.1 YHS domain protein [Jannaschia sp. S6380]